MIKLTEEQREIAIRQLIEDDMEQFYKPSDIFQAFYEGILPYKNLTDEEIIEMYEDREQELPKIKEK